MFRTNMTFFIRFCLWIHILAYVNRLQMNSFFVVRRFTQVNKQGIHSVAYSIKTLTYSRLHFFAPNLPCWINYRFFSINPFPDMFSKLRLKLNMKNYLITLWKMKHMLIRNKCFISIMFSKPIFPICVKMCFL